MKTGISSLWAYINTRNNDELQRTDIIVALKRIEAEQAETIAAAVQAEREACAALADVIAKDNHISADNQSADEYGNGMAFVDEECAATAERIAAAIRARSEANHV